jgi:hypothetical protein
LDGRRGEGEERRKSYSPLLPQNPPASVTSSDPRPVVLVQVAPARSSGSRAAASQRITESAGPVRIPARRSSPCDHTRCYFADTAVSSAMIHLGIV